MPEVEELKQELINSAKSLPVTETFSLRPRTFEEAFRFANLIAESDLIPREFHKKPANVLVAVQLGMELGVSPMQALQNLYVINGRPAIFGDLLPAIVFNSGLLESIKEEGDEKIAACTVKRKGHEVITRTFSMQDAITAKLPERNPTYKAFPKRMLQMRARALAFRDMFPDVLKGVAIREDVEDIETTATTVTTPLKVPQALSSPEVEANAKPELAAVAGGQPESIAARVKRKAAQKKEEPEKRQEPDDNPEPVKEPTEEERVAELSQWLDNATDDEVMGGDERLAEAMRGLPQAGQIKMCGLWNKRRALAMKARTEAADHG